MTEIVSGAVSTITDLGKDEAWMANWLADQPQRLGLGELEVADGNEDDDRSLVATDQDRCFSVDVQLGEMEASRGFGVLDNWARNRVRHPDKSHVAVLVTEVVSDRYRTTLETLAEHLPLVVVELQVWKGENEAIVVPHVALSSDSVDLSDTPAARAAEVVAAARDAAEASGETAVDEGPATDEESVAYEEPVEAVTEAEPEAAEAAEEAEVSDKDDTGVGNPWGLADEQSYDEAAHPNGAGSTEDLLTKIS
jgi:hypothetical protein